MFRATFLWLGLCLGAALIALTPARAEVLTAIPASAVDDPKAFWRATMKEFYGPYDNSRKCWMGTRDGQALCMRPHHLAEAGEGERRIILVAMAGYAVESNGGRADCHACGGKLGLVMLKPVGDRIALIATNSLAAEAGSWGRVPSEEAFRQVHFGDDKFGWLMHTNYMAQGHVMEGVIVYGVLEGKIMDLGYVPTAIGMAGSCDGLQDGVCYSYNYEVDTFPDEANGGFAPLLARKVESRTLDAPDVVSIPFSKDTMKYDPADLEAVFDG
ncbi:hypothetical protein [Hoeflea sp.]|uniref:hypothetical protein n=1 Tax=Hoeflea sp. TaxID=1940281 RepID=UPI003B522002